MSDHARAIQAHLQHVASFRAARQADARLACRVAAIKQYQHERFSGDYADLAASARYGAATHFFLSDLYGPVDFADRDAQFERVVPAMARLLPAEVIQTVARLAELHALSEELDHRMALSLTSDGVDERSYRAAWQAVGLAPDRQRQLSLLLSIGASLDRHTRTPLLAATLKLMRGPAKAAGLAQLQSFLEHGLAAFASMHGAQAFLDRIARNEQRVITEMFSVP